MEPIVTDENKPAEGEGSVEAPQAPEIPPAKEAPARSEHGSGSGSSHVDYNPHFEKMFQELGKLPESLINALREAVPPKQEEKPADEADEGDHSVAPPKHGAQNADARLSTDKPGGGVGEGGKRSFAQRWLGTGK